MKKEYRSILWFAVFFTLPIVIFVAIYGMDYFLERTYYEIVAAGSLSIFFKMHNPADLAKPTLKASQRRQCLAMFTTQTLANFFLKINF